MTTGNLSAPLSILVLEPNALQSDLIQLALKRHGLNPIMCSQVEDFRLKLRKSQPDAILVDTHLPNQNGLDLIGELASPSFLNRTKIFVISAFAFPETVQRAAKLGASGFFAKPLDTDLMAERILKAFA